MFYSITFQIIEKSTCKLFKILPIPTSYVQYKYPHHISKVNPRITITPLRECGY